MLACRRGRNRRYAVRTGTPGGSQLKIRQLTDVCPLQLAALFFLQLASNTLAKPTPALEQPHSHISSVASSGGSCASPVAVTIVISSPASADRELWLMAIVITGTPAHPVYYAKKELANVAGQQTATIQFYGAANGSAAVGARSAAARHL
jgi:hypothetical protein